MPASTARAPRRKALEPFTLPHFRRWASDLILDSEEPWRLEPFQEAFAEDLFSGVPQCWLIVPEGNGKTTLIAGLALYHCEFRPFASVPVAASSRDQAELLYKQAEGFVVRTDRLKEPVHSPLQEAKGKLKTEVPRFDCLEGYRRINHFSGSRIQVFAADARTGDGAIPTLGIIDELHRHRDLSLYRTWAGKLLKRKGQLVTISTAGEPDGDFERTRQRIIASATQTTRKGAFRRVVAKRTVMHEWSLPDGEDPTDLRAVKAANPLRSITRRTLAEKLDEPAMTMHHWLRFVCNRPQEDMQDCWLGPEAREVWDRLADPWGFEPKAPTWVGVDIGIKHDSSAVVAWQWRRDGERPRLHARCRIWVPTPDRPVDVTDVMAHLRELDAAFRIEDVGFDPRFFDVPAKQLADEGLPMTEVPQTPARMTVAVGGLYEAIQLGLVSHDGDEALAAQVLAAAARHSDHGFILSKGKSRGHIDAAVAAAIGHAQAMRHQPAAEPMWSFG